jgi:Cd2+/Zn2+-exporting ATPase
MLQSDQARYVVSGVCCATEETVLRKALDGSIGREAYEFNSVTSELRLVNPRDGHDVLQEIRRAGFDGRRKEAPPERQPFFRAHAAGISAGGAGLLTLAGLAVGDGVTARVLFGAAILIGGWKVARKAIGALRTRSLDMNVLMSVAVAGALLIGKWEEGAAVIVLFAVALMLETYSNERTRKALKSLLALSPDRAAVINDGGVELIEVGEVAPGAMIIVRPGERIPLDGTVSEGSSPVNEAPVTGESAPVMKFPGTTVHAGTLNGTGALRVRVTARAEDSAIAGIMKLVEEAQMRRAPVQQSVDRFARVYTPAVLAMAAAVAALPPLLAGADPLAWLYRALVLLVIACPCALVIATPVAIVSAITRAARSGILVKGGTHIETLARVATLAIDKTGTLTAGVPGVTDVLPLDSRSRGELLAIVAALEQYSEHHLASAALIAAERESVRSDALGVDAFEAIPGRGVRGRIGGITYTLGNRALGEESGVMTPDAALQMEALSAAGKTTILLGANGHPLGIIAFRDGVRSHGAAALARLRLMGIRKIVMLSGDTPAAAEEIARELGIDEVRASLLPAEKVASIEQLKREAGTVAMVGDGINDAPALAAASVGIAMGVAGTDAALDTADVVLMSDRLTHLPYLFGLSRATLRIVRQNIGIAVGVKLLFLALALAGPATLWMAILADDGAALAVILNAMRVLGYRGEEP